MKLKNTKHILIIFLVIILFAILYTCVTSNFINYKMMRNVPNIPMSPFQMKSIAPVFRPRNDIRDQSVAEETASLAQNQLLVQQGVSQLSTSSQLPTIALELLDR